MIKAKIPVIKEYYKSVSVESQLFTDASKTYIDSFLETSEEKTIMLKIFSLANPWIKFNTNIKLVESGFLPITSDETLELVLSGSVVFNHYFKNVYTSSDTGILATIRSFFYSDNQQKYTNIGGISDLLGELVINCLDSNRFEQIERFATDSIIEYYDFIGNLLDKIYTKDRSIVDIYLNQHQIDNSIELETVPEALDDIKKLMASPIFTHSYKMIVDKKLENVRQANLEMGNSIYEIKEKLGTVQNMFTVFPYYYYLIRTASKHNLFINVDKYINNMKAHIEFYLKMLVDSGIYSTDRKSQLFSGLIDVLNKYPKVSIPIDNLERRYYDGIYAKINIDIPSNLHTGNFIVRSKPDKYRYNTPGGIVTQKSDHTKNHSIIIDQTYGRITRSKANVEDKDFAKLVLNIDYGNILSFRCEIFNIKIKRFYDTGYGRYFTPSIPIKFDIKGSDTMIFIKSADDIMKELFRYVFDENEFLPWNIPFVTDILYRSLLLLKLNHMRTLEQIYIVLNHKINGDYEVFFDFDYDSTSFLKLIWIDQTINRDSTMIGQELIRFILITKELNKLDDKKKEKILNDFSNSYGTVEISVFEYNHLIEKFYSEINSIVKMLLEMK